MLLASLIAIALRKCLTEASPLPVQGDSTGSSFVFGREDSPIGTAQSNHDREIWNILWSCLATTFACTWLSVHPNVPFRNEGKWGVLGRRMFLMLFSIIAPEIMVMWAFKQWRSAVMIREAVNQTDPAPLQPWSTAHGHFLQMGGFRVTMTSREYNENGRDLVMPFEIRDDEEIKEGFLTFRTFKTLTNRNLISFPDISEDEINDKSKGDALSKGIASLQLAWFIVQIITRAIQGLAITELELTTAALAGLNSAMYLFWWSKPLDVRCPVSIQTKGVKELLEGHRRGIEWKLDELEFSLRSHIWGAVAEFFRNTLMRAFELIHSLGDLITIAAFRNEFRWARARVGHILGRVKQTFSRRTGPGSCKELKSENAPRRVPAQSSYAGDDIAPSSRRSVLRLLRRILFFALDCFGKLIIAIWLLVAYPVDILLFIPIRGVLMHGPSLTSSYKTYEWSTATRMIFYSEDSQNRLAFGSSTVAGALFGAVHCLAWNFTFPSHVEQMLWRVASLAVAGSCAFAFLGVLFNTFIEGLNSNSRAGAFLELLINFFAFTCMFSYPFARISLLVLALTSLRSLPPSAFSSVRWVEFVPHI